MKEIPKQKTSEALDILVKNIKRDIDGLEANARKEHLQALKEAEEKKRKQLTAKVVGRASEQLANLSKSATNTTNDMTKAIKSFKPSIKGGLTFQQAIHLPEVDLEKYKDQFTRLAESLNRAFNSLNKAYKKINLELIQNNIKNESLQKTFKNTLQEFTNLLEIFYQNIVKPLVGQMKKEILRIFWDDIKQSFKECRENQQQLIKIAKEAF